MPQEALVAIFTGIEGQDCLPVGYGTYAGNLAKVSKEPGRRLGA
jgi:hypothetical protein